MNPAPGELHPVGGLLGKGTAMAGLGAVAVISAHAVR
jgi:hypothetical protein